MKKFIIFILVLTFIPFAASCEKENELLSSVSEIRSDILYGKSENYEIKAYVYKTEIPLSDDGNAGVLYDCIKFFLSAKDINAQYKLSFSLGEKTYSRDFSLDVASGVFTVTVETETLPVSPLIVSVFCGGITQNTELNSIVPINALSPKAVLDTVTLNNPELFNSYKNEEGKFCAEIRLKITVKDDRPYYFFGILDGKSRKAFLTDGITGEVLAIRNVF